MQYLMYHYGKLCGLMVLASTMAMVITGFLSYHLYLVARGMTTNESAKWSEVSFKLFTTWSFWR